MFDIYFHIFITIRTLRNWHLLVADSYMHNVDISFFLSNSNDLQSCGEFCFL